MKNGLAPNTNKDIVHNFPFSLGSWSLWSKALQCLRLSEIGTIVVLRLKASLARFLFLADLCGGSDYFVAGTYGV